MKLSDVKLLHKILACFVLLGVVVGGAIWFATSRMRTIDDAYSQIIDKDVQGMVAGLRANERVYNLGRLTWRMVAQSGVVDAAELQKSSDQISANSKEFGSLMADAKKYLPQFTTELDRAGRLYDEIITTDWAPGEKAAMANKREEAFRSVAAMTSKTAELRSQMTAITAALRKDMQERSDAATAVVNRTIMLTGVLVGGAFTIVLVLAFLLVQFGIARPMGELIAVLKRLAKGEETAIVGAERGDEIGETARAVDEIKVMLAQKARAEAETKAEQDRVLAKRRKAEMSELADNFEKAVGEIVHTVSSASTELEASAITLTKTAETTQQLSTTVAAASEEASTNVQSVASATEELTASVTEIGRQVQESSRISHEAVDQARKTDDRITKLAEAASRIGDVTQLITSIAEQTNLLALNATIEAARAGVAGKGFAVVASEVKQLASQTAKATSEISTQIAEMQSATQDSVTAIKEIGGTIARISEIATAVASSVDQQGAATHEITRNVQQAATGTTQVASNITSVSRGAAETGSASSQMLTAAKSLAGESNRLKLEMSKFLATVRAA